MIPDKYINRPSLVEGLYTFYSDRRDKYRVFISGQKVNKRKKSDLIRFQNLKFLSVKFSEIVNNPNSYFTPGMLKIVFSRQFSNSPEFKIPMLMKFSQICSQMHCTHHNLLFQSCKFHTISHYFTLF